MIWLVLFLVILLMALTGTVCFLVFSVLNYTEYVEELQRSRSRLRAENIELRSHLSRRDGPRHARDDGQPAVTTGHPKFPVEEERAIEAAVEDILAPGPLVAR